MQIRRGGTVAFRGYRILRLGLEGSKLMKNGI